MESTLSAFPHGSFEPWEEQATVTATLPVQLTSFIGRADELTKVKELIQSRRLVTLAGSGGCGKTRLAVRVAEDVAELWRDGVCWLDFGPLADAELVAEVVASRLRVLVEPTGGPLRALTAQLATRQMLICLDTCEHLLEATAELVESVLQACPLVSILVTSREPLGVAGETVWRVPSLQPQEAALLFVDRAALVQPEVSFADSDDAINMICQRLDGIPLAIELAAAWTRAMRPAEIASVLDDRFRLLTGGPRRVVPRHRTLAASMNWSHDLLAEQERVVFRRLAVFAGTFSLDAARAVCGENEVVLALGRLVDKSLLVVQNTGERTGYRLLDSIRQYAQDRLAEAGETAMTRDRHLMYFLAEVDSAQSHLDRDQDGWRLSMLAMQDDLRTALEWGLAARHPDKGRDLAAALARFWFVLGKTQEGLGFLRQAIDLMPEDRSSVQASLLSGLALVALGGGRPALTAQASARGLEMAVANGDDRNRALCLVLSAYLPYFTDFAACRELAVEARAYAEAAGDRFCIDFANLMEACVVSCADHHEEATALARRFNRDCLARGERFCAAFGLSCEVWADLFTGDLGQAEALGTEALAIAQPLGDYFTIGLTTFNLAWVKGLSGQVDQAKLLMQPIVRSMQHAGPEVELLPWLALMPGKLSLWSGDFAEAISWLQLATRFAEPLTDNWVTVRALPAMACALRQVGRYDESRLHTDRAIVLARKINCVHVLAEALEEAGHLASHGNDLEQARQLHHQALAVRVEHGLRTFYPDSLESLAYLAVRQEEPEWAARLLAACQRARVDVGYPRPAIHDGAHTSALEAIRAALGEQRFTQAIVDGAALSLEEAVAYATRARGRRKRPVKGWASLTPTEQDVARLVTEGKTNPEIGTQLFMSRATVKTHLSHIYAKLQVANRTELATLAVERIRASVGSGKVDTQTVHTG